MAYQKGISWFRRQSAPITVGIIAAMIVFALAGWFTSAKGLENFVLGSDWQNKPWTLFTYAWINTPFDGLSLLFFVFLCMWMFFTGGAVERDLGPTKYIALWLIMILLPALFIIGLGPLVGKVGAAGMWLPESAITMVWCLRNPTAQIMLYGLIPLNGKILAWVTVAVNIYLAGAGNPLFGLVASLHLGVAAAYAANLIPFWQYSRGGGGSLFGRRKAADSPFLKKTERMDSGYYDDVKKREKEREERERLRKLFESSLDDQSDK